MENSTNNNYKHEKIEEETNFQPTRSLSSTLSERLPSISTSRELWTQPSLIRDRESSSDYGDDRRSSLHHRVSVHRTEAWDELFYDLIFVAAAFQLGSIAKYDLGILGLAKSVVLFTVMKSTWDQLVYYQNKFDTHDILHQFYYVIQSLAAMVMALHLTPDHETNKWNRPANKAPFAMAASVARIANALMYFQVYNVTNKYRHHMICLITTQLLSAGLFIISAFLPHEENYFILLWFMALFAERFIAHLYIYYIMGVISRYSRAPEHYSHLSHRQVSQERNIYISSLIPTCHIIIHDSFLLSIML